MSQNLQSEIHKRTPFDCPEQEAYLNLMRTQAQLSGEFEAVLKDSGLSTATYNVLRILRGAGDLGRMCHEIGEHMVTRVPDVTRLVDRLEKSGLAKRERCAQDRRVVHVKVTKAGLDLLATLDAPVLEMHRRQLGHLSREELASLNELLVKGRHGPKEA